MRQEVATSYGLRDPASGRIVRLEIERNTTDMIMGGDETCTLTLGTNPYADGQEDLRYFEVSDMRKLAVALATDREWHSSDWERPQWGRLNPRDLEPVRFTRTLEFAHGGSDADPVADYRAVETAPFPGFVDATRFKSRRIPGNLIQSYFDVRIDPDDREWIEVSCLRLDGNSDPDDAVGRFLGSDGWGNTGIVLAIAELPEDYPLDGVSDKERQSLHIVLLDVRQEDGPPLGIAPMGGFARAP